MLQSTVNTCSRGSARNATIRVRRPMRGYDSPDAKGGATPCPLWPTFTWVAVICYKTKEIEPFLNASARIKTGAAASRRGSGEGASGDRVPTHPAPPRP